MLRAKLVSIVKASERPVLWRLVAVLCRILRAVSRRRARWSLRAGYALERGGRQEQARAAYTDALERAYITAAAPEQGSGDDEQLEVEAPEDTADSLDEDGVEQVPPASVGLSRLRKAATRAVRRENRRIAQRRKRRRTHFRLFRRRGRVVPVLTRSHRRRWSQAGQGTWGAALHLLYMDHRDRFLPSYYAGLKGYRLPRTAAVRAWQWYVEDVFVQSIRLLRANGKFVRRETGLPLLKQLVEMLRLSLAMPSMPENYYKYELYRPANQQRAHEYLHGHETWPVFYRALTERRGVEELAPLDADKVAFAERAKAHSLAVAATIALVEDGKVVVSDEELPARDLFVKPLIGARGRGARKWSFVEEEDGFRRNGLQKVVPRSRFLGMLADRPVERSFIVQPCLTNHQELTDLSLGAVATCRVITILDEEGEPEPVISIFRMPAVADAVVDNMHAGGVAAAVDIESGVLTAASDYAIAGSSTRHTHHPVTGGPIEGRKLPLWDDVLDLARRAHQAFRPRVLVGWDICIGQSGPILIEGNERPGVGGLQRLHTPLGEHRFGELLYFHVARQLSANGAHDG